MQQTSTIPSCRRALQISCFSVLFLLFLGSCSLSGWSCFVFGACRHLFQCLSCNLCQDLQRMISITTTAVTVMIRVMACILVITLWSLCVLVTPSAGLQDLPKPKRTGAVCPAIEVVTVVLEYRSTRHGLHCILLHSIAWWTDNMTDYVGDLYFYF